MQYLRHLLRGVLPQRRSLKAWRLLPLIVLSGALAAGALMLVPASAESSTHDRLSVNVVATNRGPLPACDGNNCTLANLIQHFIYIKNKNELTNEPGRRDTLPNAFVVSSVDESVFVDGVQFGSTDTLVPPPNAVRRGVSGHWPATVTCPAPPDPCNIVGSPAILPGENTVIFWDGWFHGDQEPNGTYVFTFTVHGTLNGTPVDLTASSPSILMTP
jgi:hypothetical protein